MTQSSPPATGRPRSTDRDHDLLVATQDLLAEVGYDRLTIDAVAARCGAAKTTVYRRWAGKPELVTAAIGHLQNPGRIPDTGSLRGDLIEMAATWHDGDARRDTIIAGLLTAMTGDSRLRDTVTTTITAPRRGVFAAIVDRARRRGEITGSPDIELLGAVIPALTFHHVTVLAAPIDRAFIERVVDQIVMPAFTAG
ncbi:TetR family transcriptional regulator [Nocardia neocaledoniensis NBRC 108232]|uniref:TetR family transcriptional regulator n=1 Tax=Nocardia neocaledoniensis TaxID=236511 RepID=A0A317N7Q8_9NOCA|nr:TetR/AcrR family transcriptional regulator [Nocardia neocaledoniensis]PWV71059.1 TetR family transcriptional regulator [Nocardia neocaledoniensis]GEM30272.1 TetR family transcriptional regulator [Nocardia neocaledoniensis NBRC 108232]